MLKQYIATIKSLRDDRKGVVSFEYVIVAAAIVGAVVVAFGTAAGTGPISTALSTALKAITDQLS